MKKENLKKSITLIAMGLIFNVIVLLVPSCASAGNIALNDGVDDAGGGLPDLSGSTIELIDINSGDIYPGEELVVRASIKNSGAGPAENISLDLELSDLLQRNGSDEFISIESLAAGETYEYDIPVMVKEGIEEDMDLNYSFSLNAGGLKNAISGEYTDILYGVKEYEGNYIPMIGLHAIEDHIDIPIELATYAFDELCSTLKDFGYETITYKDLLAHVDFGRALPEKPVIITSDDGFQDLYTNAFPILKKYDYVMTINVVTNYTGETEEDRKENLFDYNRGVPMRPMLIWPEIKEMYDYGCEILSHSANHIRLGLCPIQNFTYQLTQSKKDIEEHLGEEVLFFAWPYDNHSYARLPFVKELGYRGAIRYGGGTEDLRTMDLMDIKRLEFNSYIPPWEYKHYIPLFDDVSINDEISDRVLHKGDTFMLDYTVTNNGSEHFQIDSFELELPENVELLGLGEDSYLQQYPSFHEEKFMWVSDEYGLDANSELKVSLIMKAVGANTNGSTIKFRATNIGDYVNANDVRIKVGEY